MKSFLQLVAESLLERYGINLSHLTVVFPGKRASLFLNQALTTASDRPVWAPAYKTISELFTEASPYALCDSVEAVCRLYRAYSHHVEEPQTLDQFYSWGEILLSDFDDIDKHLVNARQLFANISDLRAMEDNSYIDSRQEEALRDFFGKFSLEENSVLKERFLALWNQMPAIYDELNSQMRADGVLYEGALQRDVIESKRLTAGEHSSTTYVFVGFNVLHPVERALFDELVRRGQALFYWDYDTYYMKSRGREEHEAAFFLRQNLERYGNELPPSCFDNLSHPGKMTFIKASSENAQARFLPQWLGSHLTPSHQETAVVLCNEQLLSPVLHSIPNAGLPVNVTMGYPFTATPVYSFVSALAALQTDGYDNVHHRFRPIQLKAVEAHPYTRRLTDEGWRRHVEGGVELLSWIQGLLVQLGPQLSGDLIASEGVYIAYTRLSRLADLVSGPHPWLCVNDMTLTRLISRVLESATIPFHGEPATGLQVMGVLETRALDFRHILMLSVGEGYLPRKSSESSFIPYFLREAFELTTQRLQVAVYAYYFYRLIQRAEHITFVFNESNAGTRQNEISRFLRQLMAETTFPIERLVLQASGVATPIEPIVRQKTPEVMERLRSLFDNSGRSAAKRRFLSPSAMNAYTSCPMQFYYRYVKGLFIDPDPEDGFNAIFFGNIFHRAAEQLYRQLTSCGDVIRQSDLEPFMEQGGVKLQPIVREAFRTEFFKERPVEYRGILCIAERVIVTYLLQLLRHDSRLTPFRVLAVEQSFTTSFIVNGMEIDTGGIIDRLDFVSDNQVPGGQAVRVVDYKTGGRPDSVTSLDNLFADTGQTEHYFFQTILYASIVASSKQLPVTPCLFYVHRAGADDYSPKLKLAGSYLHDVRQPLGNGDSADTLSAVFMQRLVALIEEIFNPEIPFTQTSNARTCEHCDFRALCGR